MSIKVFPYRLHLDEMSELKEISIDFLRDFFSQNSKKAMIPVSGGVDSITTTHLLVEALGKDRVVAFHVPQHDVPSRDTENFDSEMRKLGIEHYKFYIGDLTEDLLRKMPAFQDMDPMQQEFFNAAVTVSFHMREGAVYAFGKLQQGRYRSVGALDRAEALTGNFPKYTCTLDVAPILGMYRQQVRGLAALMDIPGRILFQPAENGTHTECMQTDELFEKGELAQDLFLFLIYEKGRSDAEIHALGSEHGVELKQEELNTARRLVRSSEHKRELAFKVPYPEVTNLGIDENSLMAAYKRGLMIYY